MNLLTTERLILKAPCLNDLEDLYRLQANKEVMHFIGNGVRTRQEVQAGLQKAINHQHAYGFSLGSVFHKESLAFMGRAGLIYLAYDDTQPLIEVAYALLPEFWGAGYATEIATALVAWGTKTLKIDQLVGAVDPNNVASKHVLHKAGLSFSHCLSYNSKPVELWVLQHEKGIKRSF